MTRTRTLAAELVAAGFVRINGQRVSDPARLVCDGDVLTLCGHTTCVVKVVGFDVAADRRRWRRRSELYGSSWYVW